MIASSITSAGNPTFPTNAQSGATITLDASALQTTVNVTTGASDSTLTLPTTGAVDGSLIYVRKVDSGAGKVIINTTLAYLMTINDIILVRYNGSSWEAIEWQIAPVTDIFTSSGTWTKRPLLLSANIFSIGSGGGGGSGRRGAAASVRSGGGGGQGGSYNEREILASVLGATETVTISVGGAGGAAISVDSTSGSAGSNGGNSTFGTKFTSLGSSGGAGGALSATSGGSTLGQGFVVPASGGATSVTAASGTAPTSSVSPSGGGGGGPVSSGDVSFGGGGGGIASATINQLASVAGGAVDTSGSAGNSQSVTFPAGFCGGGGGSGGGGSSVTNAGSGGAGGFPGGGGGGGGGSVNAVGNSGAGGAGGDGCFYIVNYFN